MAFNIWTPQGRLTGLNGQSNPSVIYEGNPQILAGPNVFKMWTGLNNGTTGINYFESADGVTGWTASPSNPIVTASIFPTVYKVGSTYYLYSSPVGYASITVRTSSDGVTFGAPTTIISTGTAGQWDDTHVAQLNLVPNGGNPTYYAYYEGITGTGSGEGLVTATSPAGPWTKSGSNPIFVGTAPMCFQYINGTYYAWAPHGGQNLQLTLLGFNGLNRWSSASPAGPWTILAAGGSSDPTVAGGNNVLNVIYGSVQGDFDINGTGTNTQGANVSDPYMVSALGNMYVYWTRTTLSGQQSGINAAVATGVTPAQQVAGYEGMVGAPLPAYDFNLKVTASDNFQRANANPLGGNWTTDSGFTNAQLTGNLVESTATGANADSYYNAVTPANDQWSRITLQKAVSNSGLGANVRTATGATTLYRVTAVNTNAAMGLTTTQVQLNKFVNGVSTLLGQFSPLKLAIGDTLMTVVSGSNILMYYNGTPFLAATDAAIASGRIGFSLVCINTLTDSQISAWNGGGFVAAPSLPVLGGSQISLGRGGIGVSYDSVRIGRRRIF